MTLTITGVDGRSIITGTLQTRKDLEDAREVIEGSSLYKTGTGEPKLMVTSSIPLATGGETVITYSLGIGDSFSAITFPTRALQARPTRPRRGTGEVPSSSGT